jgi:transcriptional repressor NrdR
MHCPFCQSDKTKVLETRLMNEGLQLRRRRECFACNKRYNTVEIVDLVLPRIIKTNNSRESFNEPKLRNSFNKALEKRFVNTEEIEDSIQNIKNILSTQTTKEVKSSFLGKLVMDELKKLDKVAYIRFVSVYKHFQNIEEFKVEIEKLMS